MAWTNTSNVSAGSVLTATNFNQQVLGNLDALRGDYAQFRRTSGSITLIGTTTWSDLTTIGTTADLTLAAGAGDLVEAGISVLLGNEAVSLILDVITVVGSTKTNSFGTEGAVPANYAAFGGPPFHLAGGVNYSVTGSVFYTLQAGDISSSTVKLRPQMVMSAATNRQILCSNQFPFKFWARNHGPVEV